MKVTSAEFLKSAFQESDWPRDAKPEIAFMGRSNVGKSSLINSLLRVRGLARTSSTPGRTQSLNFFPINEQFRFVDLPGFGYARVPKAIKIHLGRDGYELPCQATAACAINSHRRFAPRTHKTGFAASRVA